MRSVYSLCLSLALLAAATPAAAWGKHLPRASSLISSKEPKINIVTGPHGPSRLHSYKWGQHPLVKAKTERGMSMPHMRGR